MTLPHFKARLNHHKKVIEKATEEREKQVGDIKTVSLTSSALSCRSLVKISKDIVAFVLTSSEK